MRIMRQVLLVTLLSVHPKDAHGDDRRERVIHNVRALPDVDPDQAQAMAEGAFKEETEAVPAELLVSIGWGESRYVPTVVSSIGACGTLQVVPWTIGETGASCQVWFRDQRAMARAAVREMDLLLADRRVAGDMRRALMYRACGVAAFSGGCGMGGWPDWVLSRAERLLAPIPVPYVSRAVSCSTDGWVDP